MNAGRQRERHLPVTGPPARGGAGIGIGPAHVPFRPLATRCHDDHALGTGIFGQQLVRVVAAPQQLQVDLLLQLLAESRPGDGQPAQRGDILEAVVCILVFHGHQSPATAVIDNHPQHDRLALGPPARHAEVPHQPVHRLGKKGDGQLRLLFRAAVGQLPLRFQILERNHHARGLDQCFVQYRVDGEFAPSAEFLEHLDQRIGHCPDAFLLALAFDGHHAGVQVPGQRGADQRPCNKQ